MRTPVCTAGSGTDSEKQSTSPEGRPTRSQSPREINRPISMRSSALKEASAPTKNKFKDDALAVQEYEPPAYKDSTKERGMKGIAQAQEDVTRRINHSNKVRSREVCRSLHAHRGVSSVFLRCISTYEIGQAS